MKSRDNARPALGVASVLAGLMFLLTSCANTPFFKPGPIITSGGPIIPGILPTADRLGRDDISIFLIHGMGFTDPCASNEAATMIDGRPRKGGICNDQELPVCLGETFALKGEGLWSADAFHIRDECTARAQTPDGTHRISGLGVLKVLSLRTTYLGRPKNIRLYYYFWDGDALRLQWPHIVDDLSTAKGTTISTREVEGSRSRAISAKDRERVSFNTFIKDNTIDGGFSDAVLYTGSFGSVMRQGVRSALCLMTLIDRDPASGLPSNPVKSPCAALEQVSLGAKADQLQGRLHPHLAMLSESLGSRMLFDALDNEDAKQPGKNAVEKIAERVIADSPIFYMSANQLPLLAMANLKVTSDAPETLLAGPTKGSFLTRFLSSEALADKRGVPMPKRIVAFHDPNDLLGFRAGAHMTPQNRLKFIEVSHYYATRWWFFANPIAAHAQSFSDAGSRQMIMCGATKKNGKVVVPKSCR